MTRALVLAFVFVCISYAQPPAPISFPYWGYPFENVKNTQLNKEYRSMGGHGNNVKNPLWGTEDVPFLRHQMPASYYSGPRDPANPTGPKANPEDGLDPTLPLERHISNLMMENHGKHKPNSVLINQLHVDWGHLIVVDTVNTYSSFPARIPGFYEKLGIPPGDMWADESWGSNEPTVQCFMNDHGFCRKDDKDRWLFAARWFAFPGTGAGTGVPKAAYGDVSQWLDLSALYGNPLKPQKIFGLFEMAPWLDVDPTSHLLMNDGKFHFGHKNSIDLGPLLVPGFFDSHWQAAGDFRFNKTPGLRVLLETFKREHNRLIDQFKKEHPDWSTETLFQEARRWNVAFFQSITLREYLAAATGEPLPPYSGYNETVNPGLDHFFTNVAFRYGHSAIPAFVPLLDNNLNYCPYGALQAVDVFLPALWYTADPENPWTDPATGQPTSSVRKILDHESIIRGLTHSLANNVDVAFIDDLRNFMGHAGGMRHGEDLITTDIFRTRDAGIPKYNDAREYLGLPRVTSFEEITSDKTIQGLLKHIYGSVDKIEAFVGTFAEDHDHLELGPLARASIHEQFGRWRDGDRFYFENTDHFTPKEIEVVHSTKLTDLLLRNWPGLAKEALPVNSFFLNERQLVAFKPDKDFPEPLPHPKGLYWVHQQLSPVYQLYWAIDRSTDVHEITFLIQVQTDGWAGLGFKPDQFGSMKGADIVLCRDWEDIVECRDSKALDVGVPALDTDIGGENSLRDVFVERTDGILTARFTRDMVASDPLDNDITDGLRIIFAFNPITGDLKYHGPTRNPDRIIDFDSLYIGPPQRVPITRGVTIFLYILCGICAFISVVYMIIVVVKKDYFRYQTPEFCLLVCFGTLLGYASVLLILPDSQGDGTCKAHLWLFGMSFWIVFLGFFIKVARVYYIIKRTEKTMEVTVLPFWQLFIPLIVFMLGEMVFNICWDTLVPPDLEREDIFEDNTYILYCGGNKWFWLGSVVFRAIFLGLGVILAIQTKGMPQEFNWSKEIAMSIYTMAIILGIGIPLGYALTDSATMIVMLKGLTICIAYVTVVTIVHFDSLRRIIGGKGPREQTKTSHNSVHRSKAPQSSTQSTT